MVRSETALGTPAFQEVKQVGEPITNIAMLGVRLHVNPATWEEGDVATDGTLLYLMRVSSKGELVAIPVERTDTVVSFPKLFYEYCQSSGEPCGCKQTVDRHIGNIDMEQYKRNPKKIAEIRKAFEAGELKKLIATNIFSEGVNFVHLQYLIRADGEISRISNTQIPGRLSRLFPGKDCAYLIDFVDHFSPWAYRRSLVRWKDYKEAGWLTGIMPPRDNKKET